MKKFCTICNTETEVVFKESDEDYKAVYNLYECLVCQNEIREDLEEQFIK